MSTIDKQRIASVRILKAMGYVFRDEWTAPLVTAEADAIMRVRFSPKTFFLMSSAC